MKRLTSENEVINYVDQGFEDMRSRQELPRVYIRSGNFYISRLSSILDSGQIISGKVFGLVHEDSNLSVNIDHPHDLIVAQHLSQGYPSPN